MNATGMDGHSRPAEPSAGRPGLPGRAAFTLVELLVVVAVVALLAAILAPSLVVAREHAYSVVCRNNLRQIWTLCQDSGPEAPLALPAAAGWRAHVVERGGAGVLTCPKDQVSGGGEADLVQLYFVQNGNTFCYYNDVKAGIYGDSQLRHRWVSDTVIQITYGASGADMHGSCAGCRITLGDPVTIEVPDHVSHTTLGGCGSNHWVCYGDAGPDWKSEIILQLKGVGFNRVDPRSPVYLAGQGASYAMNVEVAPRGPRTVQLMHVEYEKTVADVYGANGAADDWDRYLKPALRHFDKANVLQVGGGVQPMTLEALTWQRDRPDGIWRP